MKHTYEEVAIRLAYDPETGLLRWHNPSPQRNGAKIVQTKCENYLAVKIGKTKYPAHRVAWLLHYGRWPSGNIDHINGNGADNRIANLRIASHVDNGGNRRPNAGKRYKGVRKRGSRWIAEIKHNYRLYHLGVFLSEEDAAKAYDSAARALFGRFARPNF